MVLLWTACHSRNLFGAEVLGGGFLTTGGLAYVF